MSKSQRKVYNTIGSKKYFWFMDHSDQVKSVIGFAALLIVPALVILVVEAIV